MLINIIAHLRQASTNASIVSIAQKRKIITLVQPYILIIMTIFLQQRIFINIITKGYYQQFVC